MGERQALDDLLAAINAPNNERSAASRNVNPVPNGHISQVSGQVTDPTTDHVTSVQQANGAQRSGEGLPAEGVGMATNAAASNAARSQLRRLPNGTAAAAQRQGGHQNPPSSQSRNSQRRAITQEQIIVGHYCRHAITTLARVMQNDPRAAEAESQLKDHIKVVWSQWVRQLITRPQLLTSVANCVRGSCEAASSIDVISDFKAWYEREYEEQRRQSQ